MDAARPQVSFFVFFICVCVRGALVAAALYSQPLYSFNTKSKNKNRPGCLTVNIGDALTRWTDGVLKSTYHRVRAPKEGDPTVRVLFRFWACVCALWFAAAAAAAAAATKHRHPLGRNKTPPPGGTHPNTPKTRTKTHKNTQKQGPRYSMPYFVNPKLNYVIQGAQKRWGPVTGFDMLSKTGACRAVCVCCCLLWLGFAC